MLILKSQWVTQPLDALGVNGKDSLSGGLVTLINAAQPWRAALGRPLSFGALEQKANSKFRSVTGASTSGFISSPAPISGDRTVAIYCRPASVSGAKVIFTSTTGAGVAYWVGTEAAGTNWSIGGVLSAGANTVVVGKDQLVVVTKRGSTHSIYVDGVLKATSGSAMADGTTGSTWLRFGTGIGNTWTAAIGMLHMGAVWNRALSDSEVANLWGNPWQLFEPQRIYIPVAAAGAGSYTLNLESGSYDITGSDATLLHGYLHNLEPGSYTLSGSSATLLKNSLLNLESGSYTISGSDVTFSLAKVMNLESGSYSLTGADTTFVRSYQLNMEAGSYVLSGQDITFVYSGTSNTVTIKAGSWLRYRTIQ